MPIDSGIYRLPNCTAIDFETADQGADSACAVGMVRIEGGVITANDYWLICPPRKSEIFVDIHGLTWSMLVNRPTFTEIWPKLRQYIQSAEYLIAHNVRFDHRVLEACLQKIGEFETIIPPFLCTLKGSRHALGLKHNRLSDVCGYFGIQLQHHHAGSDAKACAEIYLRLCSRGITLASMLEH